MLMRNTMFGLLVLLLSGSSFAGTHVACRDYGNRLYLDVDLMVGGRGCSDSACRYSMFVTLYDRTHPNGPVFSKIYFDGGQEVHEGELDHFIGPKGATAGLDLSMRGMSQYDSYLKIGSADYMFTCRVDDPNTNGGGMSHGGGH